MTQTMVWTQVDRLRKARELAGLDAAELAERLDVSKATLSRMENGHVKPTRRDLMAYQTATGVSWVWLASGIGEPVAAVPEPAAALAAVAGDVAAAIDRATAAYRQAIDAIADSSAASSAREFAELSRRVAEPYAAAADAARRQTGAPLSYP